ncbi:unnamed protein product [Closterium sp. NIES-53]
MNREVKTSYDWLCRSGEGDTNSLTAIWRARYFPLNLNAGRGYSAAAVDLLWRSPSTAKEKLHWLKMQDSQPDLSNRALAKLAKVQPCQIRDWKKMREPLEVSSSCRRRLMGAGRKSKFPFMERAVYRQFLKHRGRGLAVSVSMLQKWSAKYMKHRMPGVNWRASFRWATRFRARWHLARRVKTKMGQKLAAGKCCAVVLLDCHLSAQLMCLVALLADCKAKVESFWEFVRQMRSLHDYPLDLILNADQTPLFLEMPAERTLEKKGARTVHVRSAGYEKERVTVMLAVTASGLKLPPLSTVATEFDPDVPVFFGRCGGPCTRQRVDGRITCAGLDHPGDGAVSEALAGLHSASAASGCVDKSRVQVRLRSGNSHSSLSTLPRPSGNLKKPPAELVLRWIDESWEAIPEELVKKAFVTCGISTPIDGSEDHLILAHMRDKGEVEILDDVNDLVDDELVVNPFYAEVPMPAEVLQAAAEEADAAEEDAEAAAAEEEGGVLEEGGEAEEPSDDEWWRPCRFAGEDCEEWHAGDDSE